jgi:hypothetical protein
VSGSAYLWWLRALAPFAEAGFRTGWLDRYTVTLTDGDRVIEIPRGGWAFADIAEAGGDDRRELEARGRVTPPNSARGVETR